MPTKRIFYIDALKAFAIVLVVMGHTKELWEVGGRESFYSPILSAFHMPLFMVLSGYVTNVEKFQLGKRAKMLFLGPIIGALLSMFCVGMSELLHKARMGFLFGR